MAGDWIPASTDLARKQEVCKLAAMTGRNKHEVVGLLIDFWGWASNHSHDGNLPGVAVDDLPNAVGADVVFWNAVVSVGWLRKKRRGLFVPNAHEWISKGAKARLLNSRRQKIFRARSKADVTQPVTQPVTHDRQLKQSRAEQILPAISISRSRKYTTKEDKNGAKRNLPAVLKIKLAKKNYGPEVLGNDALLMSIVDQIAAVTDANKADDENRIRALGAAEHVQRRDPPADKPFGLWLTIVVEERWTDITDDQRTRGKQRFTAWENKHVRAPDSPAAEVKLKGVND